LALVEYHQDEISLNLNYLLPSVFHPGEHVFQQMSGYQQQL